MGATGTIYLNHISGLPKTGTANFDRIILRLPTSILVTDVDIRILGFIGSFSKQCVLSILYGYKVNVMSILRRHKHTFYRYSYHMPF